jgi:nucleotide-binding universal stress UspA family protein
MSDDRPRVLVPIRVLEGQTVPESLVVALADVDVVLLGYHVLPDQTPVGQARMEFEEQAQSKLADLAKAFEQAGAGVETRLVFTHEADKTVRRVAAETDSTAVLLPNPTSAVERILVAVRGAVPVERITALAAALAVDRDVELTLFHVGADEAAQDVGRQLLRAAADFLVDAGVDPEAIGQETVVTDAPIRAIAERAGDYDLVVMGESDPTLLERIFGAETEQVAALSVEPVLVVRRPPEERDPDYSS